MRFTVLGNTDRYLAALEAGSSYLADSGGARILLDAGPGTREALRALGGFRVDTADRASTVALARGTGPVDEISGDGRAPGAEVPVAARALDAVVISHWHYDHVLDLTPVLKAADAGTPVFIPEGTCANFEHLARAFAYNDPFDPPGPVIEARPGEVHRVGDVELRFAATRHSAPSVATRLMGPAGEVLVYASDGAPCASLQALATDADALVLHALLADVEAGSRHGRVHSTGRTAGRLARDANVASLFLSHIYHAQVADDVVARAQEAFPGRVEVLRSGARYDISSRG